MDMKNAAYATSMNAMTAPMRSITPATRPHTGGAGLYA
jgi:hypothetical protein